MKIGVISDTHIPDRAKEIPQQILEEFKNVDMVIHAGDLVDLSVLDKLKTVCANVKAVWGNMDGENVKEALPEKEILQIGNYKVGIMHGYGSADNAISLVESAFKGKDLDLIVFGHAHTGINKKIGRTLFFNPGSPTDRVFSPYNSYGIIEINDKIEARIIRL